MLNLDEEKESTNRRDMVFTGKNHQQLLVEQNDIGFGIHKLADTDVYYFNDERNVTEEKEMEEADKKKTNKWRSF